MNKFNFNKLTPFKWFVLENFPFIEADFDALTEWQLFCKLGKEMNKIIDSENTLGTQMENVTNAFIELQNYVNNYFDNLDIQDEINNKLNEMAESGELTEIIAQYLQIAGLLCFNTINDLKNATNLVNGSFAQTLGYYNINDGGKAQYKIRQITNEDVIDEGSIIALVNSNNLIAELITDKVNVKQFGAYGNNKNDDTQFFIKAFNYANNSLKNIYIPKGKYIITNDLPTLTSGISITGEINCPGSSDYSSMIYDNRNSNNYLIKFTGARRGGSIRYISFYALEESNLHCLDLTNFSVFSVVDSCNFRHYSTAINCNDNVSTSITNCSFWNLNTNTTDYQILINNAFDIKINNCTLDSGLWFLKCQNASDLKVSNSWFETGISDALRETTVSGSTCPINLSNSYNCSFVNCSFVIASVDVWTTPRFMIWDTSENSLYSNCEFQCNVPSSNNNRGGKYIRLVNGQINNCYFQRCDYLSQSIYLEFKASITNCQINVVIASWFDNTFTNNMYVISNINSLRKNSNNMLYILTSGDEFIPSHLPRLFQSWEQHTIDSTSHKFLLSSGWLNGGNIQNYPCWVIPYSYIASYPTFSMRVKIRDLASNLLCDTYIIINGSTGTITTSPIYNNGSSARHLRIVNDVTNHILYLQHVGTAGKPGAGIFFEIEGLENLPVQCYLDNNITAQKTGAHQIDLIP